MLLLATSSSVSPAPHVKFLPPSFPTCAMSKVPIADELDRNVLQNHAECVLLVDYHRK